MKPHSVRITHVEEFSASHRLHNPQLSDAENERIFGICNNANGHGHNYELAVTIEGVPDALTGMVMNLNDLMKILRERVIDLVDHKHLNHDVGFMRGIVPTAENIAIAIWQQIEPLLADFEGCRLQSVKLNESKSNYVEYLGPHR